MKIPTVSGFFCFDLETTGKIFGWIGVIAGSIGAIVATIATIFISRFSCEDLMKCEYFRILLEKFAILNCSDLSFVTVPIGFFCLISAFINANFLKGIQTLSHVKILPAVYLFGFETIFIVSSQLGSYTAIEIIVAVVIGAFMIYILLAIYSLYIKVRNDYQGREILVNSDA